MNFSYPVVIQLLVCAALIASPKPGPVRIYAPILRNCHRIELYSKHSMLESVLFVVSMAEQHQARFLSTIRGVYFTIVFDTATLLHSFGQGECTSQSHVTA